MRKLLFAFIFIALLALSASATVITVGAYNVTTTWTFGGSTATIRIYSTRTFVTSTGATVTQGYATGFYKTVNCTVASTTVNCSSFTIDSTTDSTVPTAKYIADIYDSNGRSRGRYMDAFAVPTSLGTSITWPNLRTYNAAPALTLPTTYYTSEQTNAAIAAAALGSSPSINTDRLLGRGSPGTGAAEEITLGTNLSLSGTILNASGGSVPSLFSSYSNSLSAAISAIGSTKTTLLVDADTSCSSPLVVPSTLTLDVKPTAKIIKSTGCSITFQGIGLMNPLATSAVFSGFASGDVTWSSSNAYERPAAISSELWDTGDSSLSQRLIRANAAFGTNFVRIICYPRTLTDNVNFSANKDIYFAPGDYPNTTNTADAAFYLGSNSVFHGTTAARIQEGANPHAIRIVGPGDGDLFGTHDNIIVEDLTFLGSTFATGDGSGSTVLLGNCHNCAIRNNIFYETHGYAAYVGGVSDTGNYANDCAITGNHFIRIGTQVTGTINGKNIRIADNIFDQVRAVGGGTYTVIDLEPNSVGDFLEGVIVENNYIDARDYTPAAQTFAPAAVNTTADTITLPSHGIGDHVIVSFTTTGTLPAPLVPSTNYFARVIDANTIQLSATSGGATINLTSQGTGTHTATPFTGSIYGILVQAIGFAGARNITIRNNTVLGADIFPTPTGASPMALGIGSNGENVAIYSNHVTGGASGGIKIDAARYAEVFDNVVTQSASTSGLNTEIIVNQSAQSHIYNNVIKKTRNASGAAVYETEGAFAVTASGSTITNRHGYGGWNNTQFYDYLRDLTVTLNGNDYTISAVPSQTTVTTSVATGTVTTQTFTPANVNTGTDAITITAHGYNTGARVLFETTGALPAHTLPPPDLEQGGQRWYFIIRVDANTIKLANSLANALANVAIDLTDTGSGTQTVVPIMMSKFSSSIYTNNYAEDGIFIQPLGTSQIVSTAHDGFVTNIADTDYTATSASGIVVYTSLTAGRTVNLPDATYCRGKTIVVKDGAGSAGSHNITLDGNGSQTIDGSATKAITTNFGVLRVQSNGSNWITL